MKPTKFQVLCEAVAGKYDTGVTVYPAQQKSSDCYEDGGYLHVCKGTERAVFDVGEGQSASGEVQNNTRAILIALGMPGKIADRVRVEEEEDDENGYCSHCGRG